MPIMAISPAPTFIVLWLSIVCTISSMQWTVDLEDYIAPDKYSFFARLTVKECAIKNASKTYAFLKRNAC